MKKLIGSCVLGVMLLVAGCGSGPEATPTPTKTPMGQTGSEQAAATETPVPAPTESSGGTAGSAATEPAAPTTVATETTVEIGVISATQLNIRSGPSTTAEIVRMVDEGDEFTIVARSDDGAWIQVAENGEPLGWAAAEFVTVEQRTQGGGQTASAPTPATSTGAPALASTMLSPDYGTQAFLWWKEEVADRDLKLIEDGGFNWVKQTFAWETIETTGKGQFDWARADRVALHVRDHNLKLLARLSSDPELTTFWAGAPPQNIDNFADFAFALASRYNCSPQAVGCIHAFQIWNEPNLGREWGFNRPNPAQYAEMLRKTYAAIKRGNPNAIVISAGMAPTGDNNNAAMPDDIFYEEMYKAMGSSDGHFDMLGVHGAGFAAPPELDPAEAAADKAKYGGYRFFAFRHVEDIRAIMVRYGDTDKKVVLLEFGWTTDSVNADYRWHGADAGITEMVQADYLKRAYIYAEENWQPWIGLMSMLTMPNIDWLEDGNPEDEEQYWWAIMKPGYPDLYWRAAYIVLCIEFNANRGTVCPYDPNR